MAGSSGYPKMRSSGYSYPVSRTFKPARQSFREYEKFLISRVEAKGFPRMLCQVMEGSAQSVVANLPESVKSEWANFPWLTPVLGSGALEVTNSPVESAMELGRGVHARLEEWLNSRLMNDFYAGDGRLSTIGGHFAVNLAADRLGLDSQTHRDARQGWIAAKEMEVDLQTAGTILISAMLSKFYYAACIATNHPESRRSDDAIELERNGQLTDNINDPYLDVVALNHLIDLLLTEVHRGQKVAQQESRDGQSSARWEMRIGQTTGEVLEAVRTGLARAVPIVESRHLNLLTEIAWHYEAMYLSIYPGWTDLLLSVMLRTGDEITGMGSGKPQPSVSNLKELPAIVEDLMTKASEGSWRSRLSRGSAPRPNDVALAVAEILWAEAEEIERAGGVGDEHLPAAVGYVTSFDLEIEMALAALADGRPFIVVIPVHVSTERSAGDAELFWLMGKIVGPLTDYQKFRRPSEWQLLSSQPEFKDIGQMPIVVHLNGAPLLKLPTFEEGSTLLEGFRELGIGIEGSSNSDGGPSIEITHAVVVDEYLAMRHSEAEFFWSARDISDAKANAGRALPPQFSRDSRYTPRYWVALGVAFGDPAVRHRLVSQMTLRRIGRMADPSPSQGSSSLGTRPGSPAVSDLGTAGEEESSRRAAKSDVEGVAVNLRIDEDEATLLYWLGLDVVEDNCEALVHDLRHYGKHLRARGKAKHPPLDMTCPLLGAAD